MGEPSDVFWYRWFTTPVTGTTNLKKRLLISLLILFSSFTFVCLQSRVGRMRILPLYTIRLAMDMHSLLTIHSILTSLALILLSSNTTLLFLLTRTLHLLEPLFRMLQLTLIPSPVAQRTLWWRLVQQPTGEDQGTETLQQLMESRGTPPRSQGRTLEDKTDHYQLRREFLRRFRPSR